MSRNKRPRVGAKEARNFLEGLAARAVGAGPACQLDIFPFENPIYGQRGIDLRYIDEDGDAVSVRVPLDCGEPLDNIVELDEWEDGNKAEEILLKCARSGWKKVRCPKPQRMGFYDESTSTAFIFGIVDIGDMRTEVLEEANVSVFDCIEPFDPENE